MCQTVLTMSVYPFFVQFYPCGWDLHLSSVALCMKETTIITLHKFFWRTMGLVKWKPFLCLLFL